MDIKKELMWGLGITVVVIVLTVYYILSFHPPVGRKVLNKSTTNSGVTLTTAEIAKHNQASDCWIIIKNKVYNVTDYLNLHPGGADRIIQYCGTDATQAYATKDGRGSHSQQADQELTNLYIGDVNSQKIK